MVGAAPGRPPRLGEAKVDGVDLAVLAAADGEVLRLDVAVAQAEGVEVGDALQDLDPDDEHLAQAHFAAALVQQLLQVRAEPVHDEAAVAGAGASK